MFPKIILLGTILFLTFQGSFGLKVKVVKTLYQVIPRNQEQLDKLYELEWNHPEILIWSGIGSLGDAVQLLANSKDMDQYRRKTLDKVGLEVTVEFPTVDIIMQDNNNLIRNESGSQTPQQNQIRQKDDFETIMPISALDDENNTSADYTNGRATEWKIKCNIHLMDVNAEIFDYSFPETPEELLEQYRQGSDATVFKKDIPNHSSATASLEFTQSYSRTTTFSWELQENLKIFASVKSQFGVPLIASGEFEVGGELEVGANQEWTESTTKTYEIVETVEVPPHKSVKVVTYTQAIQELPLNFTAEMKITFRQSYKEYDLSNSEYNECMLSQLEFRGFDIIERLSDDDQRGITIKVNGNLKGTFGFIGILNVDDMSKNSSRFNRYDQKRAKAAMCNKIR